MLELIGGLLIYGSALVAPLTPSHVEAYVAPATEELSPRDRLEAQADKISIRHGIATSTFRNLIYSESRWNPDADNGEDRGLLQINRTYHNEVSDDCAFDPACAMEWAAQRIEDGHLDEWVAGNCYLLVKRKIPSLPRMKDLAPNGRPKVGSVAIFDYNGTPHYAYVESLSESNFEVIEANYHPALIARRYVKWSDSHLVGFWAPERSVEG